MPCLGLSLSQAVEALTLSAWEGEPEPEQNTKWACQIYSHSLFQAGCHALSVIAIFYIFNKLRERWACQYLKSMLRECWSVCSDAISCIEDGVSWTPVRPPDDAYACLEALDLPWRHLSWQHLNNAFRFDAAVNSGDDDEINSTLLRLHSIVAMITAAWVQERRLKRIGRNRRPASAQQHDAPYFMARHKPAPRLSFLSPATIWAWCHSALSFSLPSFITNYFHR